MNEQTTSLRPGTIGTARPGTIGIVSPGAMGSALAACWRDGGVRTVATLAGRSGRTAGLAGDVELLTDLDEVVAAADLVVSIVPPGAAVPVAGELAAAMTRTGHDPVVLDANAISPSTVDEVAGVLGDTGARLLDGAISGGPPRPDSDTTLYLSGPDATRWDLSGPGLRTVVVSDRVGDASAVKMCTASVYKGFSALLTQALATAHRRDVLDHVTADLQRAFPASVEHAARQIALSATKAHRFVAEMQQIAQTQQAAGLRPELFDGMAAVWESVAGTELARHAPEDVAARPLAEVLDELVGTTP